MRNDRLENRADVLYRLVRPYGGALPSEAEVEAAISEALAARGIAPEQRGERLAFVNDGRWVIECDCGAGVACTPGQDTTVCLDCGARYGVLFPPEEERERITRALLARPARLPRQVDPERALATRCWQPGQSIDDLEAETEALQRVLEEVMNSRLKPGSLSLNRNETV